MAKIEIEIGGKYTAQKAFQTLDAQLKTAGRDTGKVFTQVNAGFGSVLSQIDGLTPGIQKAVGAMNQLAQGGMAGGALALVSLAVQKCVEEFNNLRKAQEQVGLEQAAIVSYAVDKMARETNQAILAGKSALMDANLAAKEAAGDLQFVLAQSNETYRNQIADALKTKIEGEANAVGESAKAVARAEYALAEARAKQTLAAETSGAKEKAAVAKAAEAEAALALAREEQQKVLDRSVVNQRRIISLQEESARLHKERSVMETQNLQDTTQFFSLGFQIAAIDEQLKAAKEKELADRRDQNEQELEASKKVREAELAYSQAVREREATASSLTEEQSNVDKAVLEATAKLAKAREEEKEANKARAEQIQMEAEQESARREVERNLMSLENARAKIVAEGNAYGYDANAVMLKYTQALQDGLFTQEALEAAKTIAIEEVKQNGTAYALATSIVNELGEEQGETGRILTEYMEALKKGTLTQDEVNASMEDLKKVQDETRRQQETAKATDKFLDGARVDVNLPQPIETHDQQQIQKADDMIDFGRLARDQGRQAREILSSISHQGPTLRKFLRNQLPPKQKE